jgi:hypothetical protein
VTRRCVARSRASTRASRPIVAGRTARVGVVRTVVTAPLNPPRRPPGRFAGWGAARRDARVRCRSGVAGQRQLDFDQSLAADHAQTVPAHADKLSRDDRARSDREAVCPLGDLERQAQWEPRLADSQIAGDRRGRPAQARPTRSRTESRDTGLRRKSPPIAGAYRGGCCECSGSRRRSSGVPRLSRGPPRGRPGRAQIRPSPSPGPRGCRPSKPTRLAVSSTAQVPGGNSRLGATVAISSVFSFLHLAFQLACSVHRHRRSLRAHRVTRRHADRVIRGRSPKSGDDPSPDPVASFRPPRPTRTRRSRE